MHLSRRLWHLVEPLSVAYLDPAGIPAYDDAGLKGGWMRYFAARSSPLGEASPELVEATFYGFAPALIRRAIPDAWGRATPARVHAARVAASGAGIEKSYAQLLGAPDLPVAVDLARSVLDRCPRAGRPLYAAHAGLAWPDEPHLQLWWAATLLREHRGDGHIAGLVTRGIDAVESLVFHAATGEVAAEHVLPMRGWTQDDWDAAAARLQERGWVDGSGRLTTAGAEVRADLEAETDELALPPGARHDAEALCDRLEALGLGSR